MKTGQVQNEVSVLVEKNKISGVVKGYAAADPTDNIIDLKNRTVMPGLMDMHVHRCRRVPAREKLAGVRVHAGRWHAMAAIQSATLSGADLLGASDISGSIEVGKLADIIAVAVDGNPVDDISSMGRVKFVMKDGVVYKQERAGRVG